MSLTFDQTNSAVEAALGRKTIPPVAASGGAPSSVCSAYAIIAPILKALEAIPFFPGSWKNAIDQFLKVMDVICPTGGAIPAGKSFEDTDQAVKKALSAHWAAFPQTIPVVTTSGGGGGIAGQVCGVYKAIKPILDFAAVFVPGAWKAGIIAFEAVFDSICK